MNNSFDVVILADGTLQITSGNFDEKIHKDADEFLDCLEDIIGGEVISSKPNKNFDNMIVKKTKNGVKVDITGIK